MAREGVLFKNVRTPVPMTLPAHVSLFTGTLPPTHGLRDNLQNRLPEGSLTLAEMLKARGFTTGAIVSSFVLDRRFGLSQGFDRYDDRFQALHKIGDLAERKGDEATRRRGIGWTSTRTGRSSSSSTSTTPTTPTSRPSRSLPGGRIIPTTERWPSRTTAWARCCRSSASSSSTSRR